MEPVALYELLAACRAGLSAAVPAATPDPVAPECVVFLAWSDGRRRARVAIARGPDLAAAWEDARLQLAGWGDPSVPAVQCLRVEVLASVHAVRWGDLRTRFARTRRNYVQLGIAFDPRFETALLAQELNGNAILYDGKVDAAHPNAVNLAAYTRQRFAQPLTFPADDDRTVWCFRTHAVFADAAGAVDIAADGAGAGHRLLPDWNAATVRGLIERGSDYLAAQVKPDGLFDYGWFPCFDRAIPTYNTLRHASSTYALLEAWEVTRSDVQKAAIDRSIAQLTGTLIHSAVLPDGSTAAFLVDTGDEIKLGGNAVCLLAFVKYTELTGDRSHLPLLEQLALGIRHMQDADTGQFVHVLQHPSLAVKQAFRIIYYDGEAAFGLMRLYGLTRDPRWLQMVERAFEHFIAAEHWRAHDHWLGYCVNELTRWRPDERYFRFGLQNVADHLDFVLERITTFPTLLELMMAAHEMVQRLDADAVLRPLLDGLDREKFDRALEHRARYLANGHFWPELAMFFRRPERIVGSFFIRHHSFRVRIDDVEHYLSGYVAYLKHLQSNGR